MDLTRTDVLKMLLYAPDSSGVLNSPIRGKTRLQKEMFLAQKALKDEGIKMKYSFRPYHYGPFSRQLYYDMALIEKEGNVTEDTYFEDQQGVYREFKLTPKGVLEVERLIQNSKFNRIYKIVREIKRKYHDMRLKELVEFTHREFPGYVGNC